MSYQRAIPTTGNAHGKRQVVLCPTECLEDMAREAVRVKAPVHDPTTRLWLISRLGTGGPPSTLGGGWGGGAGMGAGGGKLAQCLEKYMRV